MTTDPAPRRAVTYLRISDDQSGEELGVDRQREDCVELIRRRGWELVTEYKDNDISAKGHVVRPQFERMLEAVECGEIDVIVAYALPRIVRNARDRLRLVEVCRERGVIVSLIKGNDLDPTTSAGRLLIGILGEIAQNEIDEKGERQRRAAVQRAERGLPWTSRRPFGFEDGGMVIREAEAAETRAMYAAVIAGASVRGIATDLNRRGVKTSTGAAWHGATVGQLVKSARNAAVRTYGRDDAMEEIGPAAWPAIVTEDIWRAARGILADPSRRIGASRERKYLGTGIYRCGHAECGHTMGSGKAQSTGALIYTHAHVSRAMEPVDLLVVTAVTERLARTSLADLLAEETGPDMEAIRLEAAALRERAEEIAEDQADGTMTRAQFKIANERITARLEEIRDATATASRAPVLADLVGRPDVAERFAALPLDRQRSVIAAAVVVTILPTGRTGRRGFDPDSVAVEWLV